MKKKKDNIATHTDSQGRAALALAKFGVELSFAMSVNPARRWWRALGLKTMTWYANQIYTLPEENLIDAFLEEQFFQDKLFCVDDFRGVRFEWSRSFLCNDNPSEELAKLKHNLPPKGLLAVAPEISLSRYYVEKIKSKRYFNMYNSQPGWDFPKEKWEEIDSSGVDIYVPEIEDIGSYPLELFRKLKELYLRTNVPIAYYYCSTWGGDIEDELSCIFSEEETYFIFEDDSSVTEYRANYFDRKEGDVLVEAMKSLGLSLPSRFFALHEGSFDWEEYMYSK